MCSKTTVAPLDRIKILLQAHQTHYKNLGVFSGLMTIVRKESFIALYKGNGAQMVRIFPYAATQFTAFEIYKKVSRRSFGCCNYLLRLSKWSWSYNYVAGALESQVKYFSSVLVFWETLRANAVHQSRRQVLCWRRCRTDRSHTYLSTRHN